MYIITHVGLHVIMEVLYGIVISQELSVYNMVHWDSTCPTVLHIMKYDEIV